MVYITSPRWRSVMLLFIISTSLLMSQASDVRRPFKRRRSLSRRPILVGVSTINIQFVRATNVEIGFTYVQGAKYFRVMAKEWIDQKFEQIIPTDEQLLNVQQRSVVLRNLIPGREYLLQVQALDGKKKRVGSISEKIVRTSQKCYVCNGKKDNEDCSGLRNEMECPHDLDACLNEVRYHNGIKSVHKLCAQWRPKLGKQVQGNTDITKACTGRQQLKDAACKCMCRSNLCNQIEMPCINECFKELPVPAGSSLKCTKEEKVGSVCKWSCLGGYKIKGIRESKCRSDRTWSVLSPPKCILTGEGGKNDPLKECPILEPPTNGRISCTDTNKPSSSCSFVCNQHHFLSKGSSFRTCDGSLRKWTGDAPQCTEINCPVFLYLRNLSSECTNARKVGSVCDFTCPEELKLEGASSIECLPGGAWSRSPPKCKAPDCSIPPSTFPNVLIECVPGRFSGRICDFSCRDGYERFGEKRTVCLRGNSWSHGSPICKRITCRPDVKPPTNGFVRCTDRSYYSSQCTFYCAEGYLLIGDRTTECTRTGFWSSKNDGICRKIICPRIPLFDNGLYVCNGGQSFGSVCRFTCKRGFGFREETQLKLKCITKTEEEIEISTNKRMIGKWDGPIPECYEATCPDLGEKPENSEIECTGSSSRTIGTKCTYTCDPGYKLVGFGRITCVSRSDGSANGDWSAPPPICERVECPILTELEFGRLECSLTNLAGSKCDLQCDYGYKLTGRKILKCSILGYWSSPMPKCKVIICPTTPIIGNGEYDCGLAENYYLDHECSAKCNTGYQISIEGGATICDGNGDWSSSDELICEDINECREKDENTEPTNGGCEHICRNTEGSFICSCKENYELNADGKTCRLLICPAIGAIEKGRVICLDSNNIASICRLRCVPGFTVSGEKKVTCQEGGEWTDNIGTCERISCPEIDVPAHTTMDCSFSNKFGSVCDFDCVSGFEMIGKSSVKCSADETWSNSIPKCTRRTCDFDFTKLLNGETTCDNFNRYESNCKFACDEGYEIEKEGSRTLIGASINALCQADGTWNTIKPVCAKKRCDPTISRITQVIYNGTIKCTDDNYYGSSCKLNCDIGFKIKGNFRITCSGDATWDKTLGSCEKFECPLLEAPTNSVMTCTDTNYYQSKCSFFCVEGYQMNGNAETFCDLNRKWTKKLPKCERIVCPTTYMKLLKGSVKCSNEDNYKSVCQYRCKSGYEFADTQTQIRKSFGAGLDEELSFDVIKLKCLASGVWEDSKPVCIKHKCLPPTDVLREARPNSTISCTDSDNFESVCELTCNKGFEINHGRASTQCGKNRNWKPELGNCERIRCPMFEPLLSGATQCSNSNRYQSRCLFGCYPGYKLIGSPVSLCQGNRKFSNPKPTCNKIICPKTHTELMNGNATCSDGARFESECVYVCNPGYEMIFEEKIHDDDKAVLKCQSNGEWGGKLPSCNRKQCSIHDGAIAKAKLNGKVTCSESYWFQSECIVECNDGYQLIGSQLTRCNANADWSPQIGYCEKITCNLLATPLHGSMKCTDKNKYQSVCKFKCEYGYELIGSRESECLATTTFTERAPKCNEILCPQLYLELSNGAVSCTDSNKFSSRCEYKCNEGFQLTKLSVDVTECLVTYRWADSKPKCEKKLCPQADSSLIRAAEHGLLTCDDENRYMSTCIVECFPGYELTLGSSTTVCQANQEWGPDLGVCTKIFCQEFDSFNNGTVICTDGNRYESTCTFACEPGFELSHQKSTKCQATGKFDTLQPHCIKLDCPRYHTYIFNGEAHCTDGNKFGSICKYECNKGYERISGSASAQCLADQTWDADKTGCERVECDRYDEIMIKATEHGSVFCTYGFVFDSVCTLNCDKGYELEQTISKKKIKYGEARCNEFSKWEGNLGSCTKIKCELRTAPSNGEVTCSDSNQFESSCVYECLPGYELIGEANSTCLDNEKWSSDLPQCIKIECSSTNLELENGIVKCTNKNKFLSKCSFSCNVGYEMDEVITSAVCTASRAWTDNKPTCIKKECDFNDKRIIKASDNGVIDCTDGSRYESICTLKCNKGFEMSEGKGRTKCLSTTEWSKDIGNCKSITCDPVTAPLDSLMTCSDEYNYKSTCSFICNDGFELVGNNKIECLWNRTFSQSPPTCMKTKCPSDHLDLPFGYLKCSDNNNYQSLCSYRCIEGYKMAGDVDANVVTSECLSNQSWSFEIPMCEKKTCPYDAPHLLKALEHGELVCSEMNRFGSVCTITCHEGYELIGAKTTKCTKLETWKKDIGYCEKIQCPAIKGPKYSTVSCTDSFYFNSSCTYSCEQGFTFANQVDIIDQELSLTCMSNKKWTKPGFPPQCIKKLCPIEILTFTNGDVSCTDKNLYGSECLFKCNPGYELVDPGDDYDVTSMVVKCGEKAIWDAVKQPTCRRITCTPDMQKLNEGMQHGKISCTRESAFESTCDMECHKGYHIIEGESKSTCQNDHLWTPVLGKCEKISCPAIHAPVDGTLHCNEGFLFKSHCKVICNAGFEIDDPEGDYDANKGLECKAEGEWCGDVPTCTRVECNKDHLYLEGGSVQCTNGNVFESECNYVCAPGYQMKQRQADVSVCTAHMTWSNPIPTCEKRRCPANETSIKEAEVNGKVVCGDENKYDSVCVLHCFAGHEQSGESETTCLHTGDWSNGIGLCNKIECEPLQTPINAVMKCNDEQRFESFCKFACKTGYMLTEASMKAGNGMVCQADRTWKGEVIECEKITCPSEGYTSLRNGHVYCNDSYFYKSTCLFECNGGYELLDKIDPNDPASVTVNCTDLGFWDVEKPPRCVPVKCEPTVEDMTKALNNGKIKCSRSSMFESQCSIKCEAGYEMKGGEEITICGSDKKWGPKLASCDKISCSSLEAPTNGHMVCDNGFRYMSQCVFECLPGYEKVSSTRKESGVTTCKVDGSWQGIIPKCKRIVCLESYLSLKSGEVVCTDRNRFESECQYACKRGYELKDTTNQIARCNYDEQWSIAAPICKQQTCKTEYAANGFLNCTGSDYNAVCRLSCNRGHILVNGADMSTCTDVSGGSKTAAWRPKLGQCQKIECPMLPEVTHGSIQCSDRNKYRSMCFVNCNRGYKMDGQYESVRCQYDGTWTRTFQTCSRVTCDTSYLEVDYGKVKATDSNYYRSTLTFSCPTQGHKFIGVRRVNCMLNGKWSAQKPRCERLTCPPLNIPNGFINCTGKRYNDWGSKCTYHCKELHEMQGSSETECQLDQTWTNQAPYCKGHCDIKFDAFAYGGVQCTNSHYHHSRCRFWCDPSSQGIADDSYSLHGNDFLTCKENGLWDGVPPCCAKNCPPWGKMDLFFVFDSSSSVGYRNWNKLLAFSNELLANFYVGPDNILAGAFRYNRDIDTHSEIPIGKFTEMEKLQRAIKYMPYGGWGTNTGQALRHLIDYSLRQPGNRPDVADIVILFTDGKSQDSVKDVSDELKEGNATIHVIAIDGSSGALDLKQLMNVASAPYKNHISILQQGYERLTTELSQSMGRQVCQNPCLLNNEYRERLKPYILRQQREAVPHLKKSDFWV